MSIRVQEIGAIGEFTKGFPDVPLASGVDMLSIQASDPDPVFVTLPIAEVGRVSNRRIEYDDELVTAIESEINGKRPSGIMGHITDEERSHKFPTPVAFWIGAKREGATLWGKAWVRDQATAAYFKDLKRVGGKIGTSIYGVADEVKMPNGVTRLRNLNLESLDFAPPERASLNLATDLVITSEMEMEEMPITNDQLRDALAGVNADTLITLVPATIVSELRRHDDGAGMSQIVTEMQSQMQTQQTRIAEMETTLLERDRVISEYRMKEYQQAVDDAVIGATAWNVVTDDSRLKLEGLRKVLKTALVTELALSPTDTPQGAMERVMEGHRVVVEMTRDVIAGGRATSQQTDNRMNTNNRIPTLEEIQAARARTGI